MPIRVTKKTQTQKITDKNQNIPKLLAWVRFPLAAPLFILQITPYFYSFSALF
jgi:hypothetical protein